MTCCKHCYDSPVLCSMHVFQGGTKFHAITIAESLPWSSLLSYVRRKASARKVLERFRREYRIRVQLWRWRTLFLLQVLAIRKHVAPRKMDQLKNSLIWLARPDRKPWLDRHCAFRGVTIVMRAQQTHGSLCFATLVYLPYRLSCWEPHWQRNSAITTFAKR